MTKESAAMSATNGHSVSKDTWESHNKMMLEPLGINDSEVCVQWIGSSHPYIHHIYIYDHLVIYL